MTNTNLKPLEKEMETFRSKLPEWLPEHTGKFVVICGDAVLGILEGYADALATGYSKCGLKPFLVKRIEAVETTQRFTRNIGIACRT